MRRSAMEDHYAPLGDYLRQQAAAGQHRVVLSFAQIEVVILGRPLPRSARTRRWWWLNRGVHLHAWYGWLRAGWFVTEVSRATETVTFTRGDEG